jgi:uncharacterized protein
VAVERGRGHGRGGGAGPWAWQHVPVPRERLSLADARRVALAAQGFGRARPSSAPGARAVGDVVRRLGVVQIDSVNVLARAQYLPILARLGPYDRTRLDDCSGRAPRSLFEYWGHEAALLPVGMHRLMRWRMDRVHDDALLGMVRVQREQPALVREVAEVVRATGPVTATELEGVFAHIERGERTHWGWNWSDVKRSVEYLFWTGEITSAGRDSAFRRRYAAPEAVLPRAVLAAPTPTREQAHRELVGIAARALGVATTSDLADYFRMPVAATRAAIAELLDAGELVTVAVDNWPASYAPAGFSVPRRLPASALLAPFDPLIWFRPRTERLFGMRYRIEIYTPAEQRVHGYYVLPFLHDEHLVARVDLKADRGSGRLLVQAAQPEGEVAPASVEALARTLHETAGWLDLAEVHVAPVGDLAGRVRAALRPGP